MTVITELNHSLKIKSAQSKPERTSGYRTWANPKSFFPGASPDRDEFNWRDESVSRSINDFVTGVMVKHVPMAEPPAYGIGGLSTGVDKCLSERKVGPTVVGLIGMLPSFRFTVDLPSQVGAIETKLLLNAGLDSSNLLRRIAQRNAEVDRLGMVTSFRVSDLVNDSTLASQTLIQEAELAGWPQPSEVGTAVVAAKLRILTSPDPEPALPAVLIEDGFEI